MRSPEIKKHVIAALIQLLAESLRMLSRYKLIKFTSVRLILV